MNSTLSQSPPLSRPRLGRLSLAHLLLGGIVLLSAVLHFANLQAIGNANEYYTAAVKSMLQSWHNFFFIAAEPGGSVTVDKPPLGLWVEAAFAFALGVQGWVVALPNILAGLLSLPLLYGLVKKHLGELAGLVAALTLALTPVFVATNRNNTMDGLLTFTLLLAAWAFLRATESGRLRWLLLGGLLVGLGFEIKMLQAFLPLPAFVALYFFGAKRNWRVKIGHLALTGLVILVVGLAWPLAVDLTPPDSRPYIGSSENNTVMELIVGHNGLSRLFNPRAQNGAPAPDDGGARALPGGAPPQGGNIPPQALAACQNLAQGDACSFQTPNGRAIQGTCIPAPGGTALTCAPQQNRRQGPPPGRFGDGPNASPDGPGGPGGAGGTPFSNETGNPGLLRFFSAPLAKQMSWLLPFALLGILLLAASARFAWPLAAEHQALLLWGGWLLTCLVFFSAVEGIFHAYYVIMLAPPLGALVGAAFAWFAERLSGAAARWGLVAAAAATVAFQIFAARQEGLTAGWVWLAALLAVVGAAVLWLRPKAGAFLLMAALLFIPLAWTGLTTFDAVPDVNLPTAYSPLTRGRTPTGQTNDALLRFLQANPPGTDYLVAVPDSHTGAPLVLATGQPVLYMGGFGGGDPVVDAADLETLVARGELRYVVAPQNKPEVASWLETACQPAGAVTAGGGRGGAAQLYDCAP